VGWIRIECCTVAVHAAGPDAGGGCRGHRGAQRFPTSRGGIWRRTPQISSRRARLARHRATRPSTRRCLVAHTVVGPRWRCPRSWRACKWPRNVAHERVHHGSGHGRQTAEAQFDAKRKQTRLAVEAPNREQRLTKPGLDLLELVTNKAALSITF
jgi:hypothetical protein